MLGTAHVPWYLHNGWVTNGRCACDPCCMPRWKRWPCTNELGHRKVWNMQRWCNWQGVGADPWVRRCTRRDAVVHWNGACRGYEAGQPGMHVDGVDPCYPREARPLGERIHRSKEDDVRWRTSNLDFHIVEQVRRKELGENERKRMTQVRRPHQQEDYREWVRLGHMDRQRKVGYSPGRQATLHAGHAPSLWTALKGRVWAPQKGKSGGQVHSLGVKLCRVGYQKCSMTTGHNGLEE